DHYVRCAKASRHPTEKHRNQVVSESVDHHRADGKHSAKNKDGFAADPVAKPSPARRGDHLDRVVTREDHADHPAGRAVLLGAELYVGKHHPEAHEIEKDGEEERQFQSNPTRFHPYTSSKEPPPVCLLSGWQVTPIC